MTSRLPETVGFLNAALAMEPRVGIILGTGLNRLADQVADAVVIPYENIPGFPVSTAPSHQGRLVAGLLAGVPVLVMQGRIHYYEGYPMEQVVYPVRVMRALGIKSLLVTNAAGSLNETMPPGTVVALDDHINFLGTNPLIGSNDSGLGERFPSMHEPYDQTYLAMAEEIAAQAGFDLPRGVYVAVSGPSLETRAECRMFRSLGADLVGMSTVPEVIAAVHGGMRVLAFSIVTNFGNIFHTEAHVQEDIQRTALMAYNRLVTLFNGILPRIKTQE